MPPRVKIRFELTIWFGTLEKIYWIEMRVFSPIDARGQIFLTEVSDRLAVEKKGKRPSARNFTANWSAENAFGIVFLLPNSAFLDCNRLLSFENVIAIQYKIVYHSIKLIAKIMVDHAQDFCLCRTSYPSQPKIWLLYSIRSHRITAERKMAL